MQNTGSRVSFSSASTKAGNNVSARCRDQLGQWKKFMCVKWNTQFTCDFEPVWSEHGGFETAELKLDPVANDTMALDGPSDSIRVLGLLLSVTALL